MGLQGNRTVAAPGEQVNPAVKGKGWPAEGILSGLKGYFVWHRTANSGEEALNL